jgi:hypothetical protein
VNFWFKQGPGFLAQTGMWQLDNLICDQSSVCGPLLEDEQLF